MKKDQRKKTPQDCAFCKKEEGPDYKKHKVLEKYLSDRARIYGRDWTGVCSRHQRHLKIAIKRARHLGLLPFTPSL